MQSDSVLEYNNFDGKPAALNVVFTILGSLHVACRNHIQ